MNLAVQGPRKLYAVHVLQLEKNHSVCRPGEKQTCCAMKWKLVTGLRSSNRRGPGAYFEKGLIVVCHLQAYTKVLDVIH